MRETFEEMESRRLDLQEKTLALTERELDIREKAIQAESAKYAQGVDSEIKEREDGCADWRAHRDVVEAANARHAELLERIAVALEHMVKVGAQLQ
jgi:hypothetical protein